MATCIDPNAAGIIKNDTDHLSVINNIGRSFNLWCEIDFVYCPTVRAPFNSALGHVFLRPTLLSISSLVHHFPPFPHFLHYCQPIVFLSIFVTVSWVLNFDSRQLMKEPLNMLHKRGDERTENNYNGKREFLFKKKKKKSENIGRCPLGLIEPSQSLHLLHAGYKLKCTGLLNALKKKHAC